MLSFTEYEMLLALKVDSTLIFTCVESHNRLDIGRTVGIGEHPRYVCWDLDPHDPYCICPEDEENFKFMIK